MDFARVKRIGKEMMEQADHINILRSMIVSTQPLWYVWIYWEAITVFRKTTIGPSEEVLDN